MQTNVLLPQVEITMESARIAKWLVRVGDQVKPEQPLLEVETQKAVNEIPSPAAGFVRRLCVVEGETINEKALLCILTETADEPLNGESAAQKQEIVEPAFASAPTQTFVESADAIKASPIARRVAKDLGINLSTVKGTGPRGRISEEDVRAAVRGTTAVSADGDSWKTLPASRVALIELMQKSLAEIPQIHIQRQLDVTALSIKSEGITFTHRLVVAVAAALKQHPALRTVIQETRIKVEPVSVAIAMDTPHGLVAPAVRNADRLSLDEVSLTVKSLRSKAEANSLGRAELTNAPFAITNLGMFDVDQFSAFVFHGQTAVLSVGRSADASYGRKIAWFGLAVDHRIVDGAEAARFLQTLGREIDRR